MQLLPNFTYKNTACLLGFKLAWHQKPEAAIPTPQHLLDVTASLLKVCLEATTRPPSPPIVLLVFPYPTSIFLSEAPPKTSLPTPLLISALLAAPPSSPLSCSVRRDT